VRGTSFEFDTRNLRVHNGTVAFMGKWGYQVSVQEGQASVVTASGTPSAPQSASTGGSASQQGVDSVGQSGFGYDNTAGPTGGTGVVSTPAEPPPAPPPTKPPGGGGGSGSGGGDGNGGNVGVTATY